MDETRRQGGAGMKSKDITLQNSRIKLPKATDVTIIAEAVATLLAEKFGGRGTVRCFDAETRLGCSIEFETEGEANNE
jgi:hypothetical protein